jgi:hypothetical protein
MKFEKVDHVEISDGGTEIISSKKCPLKAPLSKNQVFHNAICCVIEGQPPAKDYRCPWFFKVTYDGTKCGVDCNALSNALINSCPPLRDCRSEYYDDKAHS